MPDGKRTNYFINSRVEFVHTKEENRKHPVYWVKLCFSAFLGGVEQKKKLP